MAVKKQRQANLDLLRIIAMLLIIFLHTIDHSGVLEAARQGTWMHAYIYYGYMLAQVCVNVFVLISGYFLVSGKFRLSKLVTLWAETVFYALIIRLLFIATGQEAFSITSIISCFVPILTGRYWFITIYVAMYCVSPFLNLFVRALSKKQLGVLNVVLFGLFSVWSSLHPSIAGVNSGGGWGLAWFGVLYLMASWLRLYYVPTYRSGKYWLAFFGIPLIIVAALLSAQWLKIDIIYTIVRHWYKYNSVPAYASSLALVMALLNTKINSAFFNKLFVFVSPLTFAVYLIHAHANVDPWMWSVLKLPEKMELWYFPLIQIGVTLMIFAACCMIECVRKFVSQYLMRLKSIKRILAFADALPMNVIQCVQNKTEK